MSKLLIIPKAAAELFSVMSETKKHEGAVKLVSGYMWVNESSVPTVCAYGVCDKVCPFDSAKHLVCVLEENNVTHAYFEMLHSGHGLQNDTYICRSNSSVTRTK